MRLGHGSDFSLEEWRSFFREGRETLAERSRSLSEALANGRATLVQQAELLRLHMREKMVMAEGRLDAALSELARQRRTWAKGLRTYQSSQIRRRRPRNEDLRAMYRNFRAARREARQALRDITDMMAHPEPLALVGSNV